MFAYNSIFVSNSIVQWWPTTNKYATETFDIVSKDVSKSFHNHMHRFY